MQIRSTLVKNRQTPHPSKIHKASTEPAARDVYTPGTSDRLARAVETLSKDLWSGGVTALPGVGAAVNLAQCIGAGMDGKNTASNVAFGGAVANLAGTVSLLGAALAQSPGAAQVGLGLLATSGVAGAYTNRVGRF